MDADPGRWSSVKRLVFDSHACVRLQISQQMSDVGRQVRGGAQVRR